MTHRWHDVTPCEPPAFTAVIEFPTRRFFQDYKTLEGKVVEVDEFQPGAAAFPVVDDAWGRYSSQRRLSFRGG